MWIGRGKEDWWVNLSKNVYSWDSRMHFCQEVRSLLDWVSKVLIHNAYAPCLFIRVPIPVPHPNPSHYNQSALLYREKFFLRGEQTCHQSRHILPQVINDTENFTWYLARFNEVVKGSIQSPQTLTIWKHCKPVVGSLLCNKFIEEIMPDHKTKQKIAREGPSREGTGGGKTEECTWWMRTVTVQYCTTVLLTYCTVLYILTRVYKSINTSISSSLKSSSQSTPHTHLPDHLRCSLPHLLHYNSVCSYTWFVHRQPSHSSSILNPTHPPHLTTILSRRLLADQGTVPMAALLVQSASTANYPVSIASSTEFATSMMDNVAARLASVVKIVANRVGDVCLSLCSYPTWTWGRLPFLLLIFTDSRFLLPTVCGSLADGEKRHARPENATACECKPGWSGINCNGQLVNRYKYVLHIVSSLISLCSSVWDRPGVFGLVPTCRSEYCLVNA